MSYLNTKPGVCDMVAFGKVIEWWTGLKDKNGQDIYENDILQTYRWNGTEIVKDDIGQVIWHPYACRYSISTNGGSGIIFELNTSDGGCYSKQSHDEVIGNIHENPELLSHE